MEIFQLRVAELNIKFEHEFIGGNLMGQSSVIIHPVIVPSAPNDVFVQVSFYSKTECIENNFNLDTSIVKRFKLTNHAEVNEHSLFECIDLTRCHLQKVLYSIFGESRSPLVPAVEYDDISETLTEHLRNLYQ